MCLQLHQHFYSFTLQCHTMQCQAGVPSGLLNRELNGSEKGIMGKLSGPNWLIAGSPCREFPPIGSIPAVAGGGCALRT